MKKLRFIYDSQKAIHLKLNLCKYLERADAQKTCVYETDENVQQMFT